MIGKSAKAAAGRSEVDRSAVAETIDGDAQAVLDDDGLVEA